MGTKEIPNQQNIYEFYLESNHGADHLHHIQEKERMIVNETLGVGASREMVL